MLFNRLFKFVFKIVVSTDTLKGDIEVALTRKHKLDPSIHEMRFQLTLWNRWRSKLPKMPSVLIFKHGNLTYQNMTRKKPYYAT